LRYTFVTQLFNAQITPEWREALSGHSQNGINAKLYNQGRHDLGAASERIELGLAMVADVLNAVCQRRKGDW
jgi:hypothetical protein